MEIKFLKDEVKEIIEEYYRNCENIDGEVSFVCKRQTKDGPSGWKEFAVVDIILKGIKTFNGKKE